MFDARLNEIKPTLDRNIVHAFTGIVGGKGYNRIINGNSIYFNLNEISDILILSNSCDFPKNIQHVIESATFEVSIELFTLFI